jgi:hypothetical protein
MSFASVSSQLNLTMHQQSRENIPSCFTDSLCTPVVETAVWTAVGLESVALFVFVILYIYFALRVYSDSFQRFRRMATSVRCWRHHLLYFRLSQRC